jgi:hypothetical protein
MKSKEITEINRRAGPKEIASRNEIYATLRPMPSRGRNSGTDEGRRELVLTGMNFMSTTRLSHSSPSATANDMKIALATTAHPTTFSIGVSPFR